MLDRPPASTGSKPGPAPAAVAVGPSGRSNPVVGRLFDYFGNESPVGRHVGLAPGVFDVEIVGVVKDGSIRVSVNNRSE